MPATLVCQSHAVFVELLVVELRLRLLKLQVLVLRACRSPGINLGSRRRHVGEYEKEFE